MKLKITATHADGSTVLQEQILQPDIEGIENQVINLYPEITYQTLEGFGGAVTDAAGYVYSLMSAQQKQQLMQAYFSANGAHYGIVRIHMDSCDFSTEMYEAMSDPHDPELRSFSFARTEKYIIPMLRDAEQAAGRPLKLMLSPWSPPAFMKTNNSRKNGGSLKAEYYSLWAEYLCRYILEFQKRGFDVQRISIQNEPKAVQTWDSCVYTAQEEKSFLRDSLYPALRRHGLQDIEVFIWDHNKERVYERVRDIMDPTTASMIAGAAFHWYSGDHFEALELVRDRYPGLKLIVSESCIEYSKYDAGDQFANAGRLAHEIIGDLNHGMCAFYDWNLLLDETGGPNHVGNFCHAPFLYDQKQQKLLPQLLYTYFTHFSHDLQPGAKRIAFTRYTDSLDGTAFQNPDGRIIAVLLNRTDHMIPAVLRINDQIAEIQVEKNTIMTCELC